MIASPIKQKNDERFIVGEPFDHTKEHSDDYYEQYIAAFEPNNKKKYIYRFIKRTVDIIGALIMLIVLSPLMLIIAITVKLDSPGEIIFKQKRIGKNGRTFCCYKFRSMKTDAPKDRASSLLEHSEHYLTRVGRILRRSSLDELPQLWCVLCGTMSFIGYRPLCLTEQKCNDMRMRLGVFAVRPGISGYAQVSGRDNVYYKNKAILDAEYVKNASLWFDIKLVIKTIRIVFTA